MEVKKEFIPKQVISAKFLITLELSPRELNILTDIMTLDVTIPTALVNRNYNEGGCPSRVEISNLMRSIRSNLE